MLSDSVSEAITSILQSVKDYSDYSFRHKRRIVLSLAHLYIVLWTLDRLRGEMTTSFDEAKTHASIEFEKAINDELSYLD